MHEWIDIVKDLRQALTFNEAWKILFGKRSDDVIRNRKKLTGEPFQKVEATLEPQKVDF